MEVGIFIIFTAFLIAIAPFISSVTKIPIIVIEILLGTYGAYVGILKDYNEFQVVAKIGFLYLMFLAGMEVNLKDFKFSKNYFLKRIIPYFTILYFLSFSITFYLGLSPVYIVAFSIFSLGVLMTLVKEYGHSEPWLKLSLSIGVIGELISIIALAILSSSLDGGFNVKFFLHIFALIIFLLSFVFIFKMVKVIFWWFPELKTIIMPYHDNKDNDIKLSMALMFALIGLMIILKIDMVLGAFLAGFFIRSFFMHKVDLQEKLSSFGFGFLIPIFFIYVGSTLPMYVFTDKNILLLALFISSTMLIMRFISSTISYVTYFGIKNTILFSLSGSMPLTFLVAIATLAKNSNAITNEEYYSFILASMLSVVLFIVAIKILHQIFKKREEKLKVNK